MEVIKTSSEMTAWSNEKIVAGKSIALVPTMGCLHDGHLSLMRNASVCADIVVASLFVNPMQFGPHEDFSSYPRTFEEDAMAARNNCVNVLFAPPSTNIYPEGFQTKVSVENISEGLCGKSRPDHFDGVTTVVAKLFNIVKPHVAVFGQKDYQQLAVIRAMVRDLDMDIEIVGHPIVREHDGLAMSSRNRYLSESERQSARCLFMALENARNEVQSGLEECAKLIEHICIFINKTPETEIDYIEIIDEITLQRQTNVTKSSVLAIAVKIGKTRLIDNGYLIQ